MSWRLDEDERAESVSDFTRRVKTLLETQIRAAWVRGEVSNLRVQASGHAYFSLKDAGAQVSAVMFRGDGARQPVKLRDGAQVVVYGEVSVYEARGQYQLIVRVVVEDGVGRLQREFEALKARLAEEGLFAAERKRAIPALPRTVGFVTSPTGAAVQDFVRIMTRRGWRGRLVVLPAKVQGAGAAEEMAAMLEVAAGTGLFELIVIGRGGGSLEDLWAFNEEVLVRAVAGCPVPVISAVGHEIDFTLCDFAADARAETPSGAAELILSRFVEGAERATRGARALAVALENGLAEARTRVERAGERLRFSSPAAQVERAWLRLDDLRNRLAAGLTRGLHEGRRRLGETRVRWERHAPERRIELESHRLLALWKRLQAASPASVLNRGFVILRDGEGRALQRRAELRAGSRVEAEFADGRAGMRVEGGRAGEEGPRD